MIGTRRLSFGADRAEAVASSLAGPLELSRGEGSDPVVLTGRHRGVPIRVEVQPGGEVLLRARLKSPLPAGLRIAREREPEARSDLQLGDIALDRLLRIESKNPAGAIRLLRDERLRRPLEAFFAHPGACAEQDELRVGPLPEATVSSLRAVLADACALVPALEVCAEALAKAHAAEVEQLRREGTPELGGRRFVALAPSEEVRTRHIREAFARGRRRSFWIGLPLFGTGMASAVASTFIRSRAWQESWQPLAVLVGVLLGLAGAALIPLWCRCPACGRMVRADDGAVLFNAEECGSCGVKLR